MKLLFLLSEFDEDKSPLIFYCVQYVIQGLGTEDNQFTIISRSFPEKISQPETQHFNFDLRDSQNDLLEFFETLDIESYSKIFVSADVTETMGSLSLLGSLDKNFGSKLCILTTTTDLADLESSLKKMSLRPILIGCLPRIHDSSHSLEYFELPIVQSLAVAKKSNSTLPSKFLAFSFLISEGNTAVVRAAADLAKHLKTFSWLLKPRFKNDIIRFQFEVNASDEKTFKKIQNQISQYLREFEILHESEISIFQSFNAQTFSAEVGRIRIFMSDDPEAFFLAAYRAYHGLNSFFSEKSDLAVLFRNENISEFVFAKEPWFAADKISQVCCSELHQLRLKARKSLKLSSMLSSAGKEAAKNLDKIPRRKFHLVWMPQNLDSYFQSNLDFDHLNAWKSGSVFIYAPLSAHLESQATKISFTFFSNFEELETQAHEHDVFLIVREGQTFCDIQRFTKFIKKIAVGNQAIFSLGLKIKNQNEFLATDGKNSVQAFSQLSKFPFFASASMALKALKLLYGESHLSSEILNCPIVSLPLAPVAARDVSKAHENVIVKQTEFHLLNRISATWNWPLRQVEFIYHSLVD